MKRKNLFKGTLIVLLAVAIVAIILPKTEVQATDALKLAKLTYSSHVQDIGWMSAVNASNSKDNAVVSGTTGRALRVEAVTINAQNLPSDVKITYNVHSENRGWTGWKSLGTEAGTTGQSLRAEAISISAEGLDQYEYQLLYRAHVQNVGWMEWVTATNGQNLSVYAGTTGRALRMEALQIALVRTEAGKVADAKEELSSAINSAEETLEVADPENYEIEKDVKAVEDAKEVLEEAVETAEETLSNEEITEVEVKAMTEVVTSAKEALEEAIETAELDKYKAELQSALDIMNNNGKEYQGYLLTPDSYKDAVKAIEGAQNADEAKNAYDRAVESRLEVEHEYADPEWLWEGYEEATATFTCENDGDVEEEKAEITNEVTTEPTCEEDGVRTYTATVEVYGEKYTDTKTETIPAIGHEYGDAEWSWEGYEEVTATFTCENDVSHIETVNAEITSETTPATCEEDGETVYTATVVFEGKEYTNTKTEVLPAIGHTYKIDEAVEPTCTETGLTTGSSCEVCGKIFVKQEIIPATGHKYGEAEWSWEGYEEATATFTCENDIAHVETVEAEITSETTEATCEEDGKIVYTAIVTFEGKEYKDTKTEVLPATGHNWSERTNVTYTVEEGKLVSAIVFTCTNDTNHKETVVPVITETRTEPTCTEDGLWYHSSVATTSDGKKTVKSELKSVLPAAGHTVVVDEAVAATCTEDGLTEGSHCSVCNEILVNQEVLPALGHDYVGTVTEPTCTEMGYTTYVCSHDAAHQYVSDYTNATGHTIVVDKAKAATCTEEGLTEGAHCSVCDEILVQQEKTEKIAHDYSKEVIDKEATCTEKGSKHIECTVCGETKADSEEEIDMVAHDYAFVTDEEATCIKEGKGHYECSVCGTIDETRSEISIPMVAHTFNTVRDEERSKNPTCENDGYDVFMCTTEGCVDFLTVPKKAIGHDYSQVIYNGVDKEILKCSHANCETPFIDNAHDWDEGVETTAPICYEEGIKTYTCKHDNCGATYTEAIAKIDHTWDEGTVTKKPTCTETGIKHYNCVVCREHYKDEGLAFFNREECQKDEVIPALGGEHEYEYVVYDEPWCEYTGMKHLVCKNCGEIKEDSDEIVPATGHIWDEGKITEEATCTSNAIITYTCTNEHCGYGDHKATYEEEVPDSMIPHTWEIDDIDIEDCSEGGTKTYICSVCGEEKTENIEPTEHVWGEWVVDEEPTHFSKGEKYRDCTVCYETEWEDIPKIEHDYTYDTEIITEATCTTKGRIRHICSCGKTQIEVTDMLPHSLTKVEAKDPTCTEGGNIEYWTCSECGKLFADSEGTTEVTEEYVIITTLAAHNYVSSITEEPTCTEKGVKTYTCTVCGNTYTEEIDALGHNYEFAVTQPTCTEQGYTTHTCTRCDDSYVDSYVDALGHNYETVVIKEPTCTETGLKQDICSRCGDEQEEVETPALGHDYVYCKVTDITAENPFEIIINGKEITVTKANVDAITSVDNTINYIRVCKREGIVEYIHKDEQ